MALTDDDKKEIYSMILEALEAVEIKEKAKSARRVSEKIALDSDYESRVSSIRKKAKRQAEPERVT